MAVLPNHFVHFLPVGTCRHRRHQNVFGGHVREVLIHFTADNLRVHHQSIGQVLGNAQSRIGRQKRLRENQPPVDAVIERAFEPLRCRGLRGIGRKRH